MDLKALLADPNTARFEIGEPIWKTKSVGLAKDKIGQYNLVKINFTKKDGTKPYPHVYGIHRNEVIGYPLMRIPRSPAVIVYDVPIARMQIVERRNP